MYVKELKRAAALTLSAVLALGNIPVGGGDYGGFC